MYVCVCVCVCVYIDDRRSTRSGVKEVVGNSTGSRVRSLYSPLCVVLCSVLCLDGTERGRGKFGMTNSLL